MMHRRLPGWRTTTVPCPRCGRQRMTAHRWDDQMVYHCLLCNAGWRREDDRSWTAVAFVVDDHRHVVRVVDVSGAAES
jgi:hypothetical protein